MAIIHKIQPSLLHQKPKKRVAAYARVSRETERTFHSLSAQVSYYSSYIQNNPDWDFVGVYADNGISGTAADSRQDFIRMLKDCEERRIDIILTKSISRFARNTVDLLMVVRQLKAWGIEIRFEKEHINTLSEDGEFMITILAAFAQEEARVTSMNVKWALRKGYAQGKFHGTRTYGYTWDGTRYVIEPDEAEVVRLIYRNYLDGISAEKTKAQLDARGIRAVNGGPFNACVIREILENITYTGDVLLQKTFAPDMPNAKRKKNQGELAKYLVQGTHEEIISKEMFMQVQMERQRRQELGFLANMGLPSYCFTTRLKCEKCGKNFTHRIASGSGAKAWVCSTRMKYGSQACDASQIPDIQLRKVMAEVLGLETFDEGLFLEKVDYLSVPMDGILCVHFKDGMVVEKRWVNNARRDSQPRVKKYRRGDGPGQPSWLTGRIRCRVCGHSYYRRLRRPDDRGFRKIYWKCPKCEGTAIYEDEIVKLSKEYTGDNVDNFKETVDYLIPSENEIEAHMIDGKTLLMERLDKKARKALGNVTNEESLRYCFSRKIRCGQCGRYFIHDRDCRSGRSHWICATRRKHREEGCKVRRIPELKLMETLAESMGLETFDENIFKEKVDYISVPEDFVLHIHFKDGSLIRTAWGKGRR